MRSSSPAPLSPIMMPELGYPPFSPSEDNICSSPEEIDTLQTPLVEHDEHHIFPRHLQVNQNLVSEPLELSEEAEDKIQLDLALTPDLFPLRFSSPIGESSDPDFHASIFHRSSQGHHLTDPLFEINPFAPAFTANYNHDQYITSAGPPPSHHPPLLAHRSDSVFPPFGNRPSFLQSAKFGPENTLNLKAGLHSSRFPPGHLLNPFFVRSYEIKDELGSGGYGFVMIATHRTECHDVAVKFIIKSKVPDYAWMEDDIVGRMPTEVFLLSYVDHPNIVKCLDLFEDELYFYLIQELHGSPWPKLQWEVSQKQATAPKHIPTQPSLPSLSPSTSEDSLLEIELETPPQSEHLDIHHGPYPQDQASKQQLYNSYQHSHHEHFDPIQTHLKQPLSLRIPIRPDPPRRPSHDLFECIEQSPHKRFSESQARYVFAQVVEAIHYLHQQGITHRDVKDENIVIDKDFNVKLIDFGSAIIEDPAEPSPYYNLFFGTTAYASSEILRKQPYQAPPAEIWTLGILLSYLLVGASPFPSDADAIEGRIVLKESVGCKLSHSCLHLLQRCLDPDPDNRADIKEVRAHQWLECALERH